MKLLSDMQVWVLQNLRERRMGVLEVHANSAAALMYRECIVYHTEKSGYITYRITKEGEMMLAMQEHMNVTSKTFDSVRKKIMGTKQSSKKRASKVVKSTKTRVRRRQKAQLRAVA